MLGTQNLVLFVGAVVALSATPGPDMMYIVSRSVSQGRMAGAVSVLGVSTALLCHSFFVAFGLATLLSSSQLAFDIVRYLGAAYLLFLGIQAWCKKSSGEVGTEAPLPTSTPLKKLYFQGFVTGLLNPKTTMFFAALLPQFVQRGASHSPLPFLFLGVLVVLVSWICDMLVAFLCGTLSTVLRKNQQFNTWTKRVNSIVYVGLALNLLRIKKERTLTD